MMTDLKGIEHSDDLVEVAARGGGVGNDEADDLLRVDDVNRADGQRQTLLVEVSLVKHAIEHGDLAIDVGEDWVADFHSIDLVYVLNPLLVVLHSVDTDGRIHDITLIELRSVLLNHAQLGCAHGGEVTRVREQDSPFAVDVIMPLDLAQLSVDLRMGA
jgi:hypothetical protein